RFSDRIHRGGKKTDMLLIAIKIWLLGLSFAHILPKELLYLSFFGLVSYLSISTEPLLQLI
ncbi:MAG: hypothetical protein PHH09_12530, partial [Methanoregulaceae archaeon]|nr:hypothetical protein [Methanoregulaceae archaeon]